MSGKYRVFIGSSKEGLPVARQIKETFGSDFECHLWTDGVFKSNQSVLQTLLEESGSFDFGLMVMTKDDIVESRGETFTTPRDNIIFEFGIFIGRAGDRKAFALLEDDPNMKTPSDLNGVEVRRFSRQSDCKTYLEIGSAVKYVEKEMRESAELGWLGMLPSTVLAIGYFENFVQPIVDELARASKFKVGDDEYRPTELTVVLPNDLDADIKKRASIYYVSKEMVGAQIEVRNRPRPLYAMCDCDQKTVSFYDMPTTLESLNKAIDMYLRVGHIGKSQRQAVLERRELDNFRKVLESLCKQDAYCRKYVRIINED